MKRWKQNYWNAFGARALLLRRPISALSGMLLLGILSVQCKSVQNFFSPIYITAGLETTAIRFVSDTPSHNLAQSFSQQISPDMATNSFVSLKNINSEANNTRGFYTLRSNPTAIAPNHWLGKYFAYSFTLDSPRIFRGELFDYPDKGIVATTWQDYYALAAVPQNDVTSRRMDYIYEDTRAYGTLYLGIFDPDGFSFALGINYGQVHYNLTLIDGMLRVSEVLGKYRPMFSSTLMVSYSISRFFPGSILEDSSLYLEATSESNSRYPLTTQVLRTDGTHPPSLFLQANFVRLGITKKIDLIPQD